MPDSRLCSIPECSKPIKARKLCSAHHTRWLRHGRPSGGGPPRNKSNNICSISDCNNPTLALGFCNAHYKRLKRNGDPLGGRASSSEIKKFITKIIHSNTIDQCIIWPYTKDGYGYGVAKIEGKLQSVHRYVCTAKHGISPTPKHQAAHNCGNGHLGCCNPNHLRWATAKQNYADRFKHGTVCRGENNPRAKLTTNDVLQIRKLKGTRTQAELALRYNVSAPTIGSIYSGKSWSWLV